MAGVPAALVGVRLDVADGRPRLLFACALIVLFAIDLEHHLLPNAITLPGIVVGLIVSLVAAARASSMRSSERCSAAACSGLIGEAYYRYSGQEGMGGGDVKMLAMIGAFLGWKLVLVTLVLSSVAGSLIGMLVIAITPRRHEIRAAVRHLPRARRAGRLAVRRSDRGVVCGDVRVLTAGPQVRGLPVRKSASPQVRWSVGPREPAAPTCPP